MEQEHQRAPNADGPISRGTSIPSPFARGLNIPIKLEQSFTAAVVSNVAGAERLLAFATACDAIVNAAHETQLASTVAQLEWGEEAKWPDAVRASVLMKRGAQNAAIAEACRVFGDVDHELGQLRRSFETVPETRELAFGQLWATETAYEAAKQDALAARNALDDAKYRCQHAERAVYERAIEAMVAAGQKVVKQTAKDAVEDDNDVDDRRDEVLAAEATLRVAETDLSIRRQRMLTARVVAVLKFGPAVPASALDTFQE